MMQNQKNMIKRKSRNSWDQHQIFLFYKTSFAVNPKLDNIYGAKSANKSSPHFFGKTKCLLQSEFLQGHFKDLSTFGENDLLAN